MSLWIHIAGSFLQHPMDKLSFSPQVFISWISSTISVFIFHSSQVYPIYSQTQTLHNYHLRFSENLLLWVSTSQPVSFAMILISTNSSGSWLATSFQVPVQHNLTSMLHRFALSTLLSKVYSQTLKLPLSSQRRTFAFPTNSLFCFTHLLPVPTHHSFLSHLLHYFM